MNNVIEKIRNNAGKTKINLWSKTLKQIKVCGRDTVISWLGEGGEDEAKRNILV